MMGNRDFLYKMIQREGSRNFLTSLKRVTVIDGKVEARMRTLIAA